MRKTESLISRYLQSNKWDKISKQRIIWHKIHAIRKVKIQSFGNSEKGISDHICFKGIRKCFKEQEIFEKDP